jgi:hypothetical protein
MNPEWTRRDFVKGGLAAVASASLPATGQTPASTRPFLWGALLHMGTNMWSDYYWNHPAEFLKRMPKSVLQSNWYYGPSFEPERQAAVQAYLALERAGFEQVPTGSNWSCDVNFQGMVDFCGKHLAQERLKGFLMAPWFFTLPEWREKNLQAIAQVEQAIQAWSK